MVLVVQEVDHFKEDLPDIKVDIKVDNNINNLKWVLVVPEVLVHKEDPLLSHQDMVILDLAKIKCEILFVKTIFVNKDLDNRVLEVLAEVEAGLTMDLLSIGSKAGVLKEVLKGDHFKALLDLKVTT